MAAGELEKEEYDIMIKLFQQLGQVKSQLSDMAEIH